MIFLAMAVAAHLIFCLGNVGSLFSILSDFHFNLYIIQCRSS